MAAKISIRKMGTRAGQPHYGAECRTCHTILISAHASREGCKIAGERHKSEGCRFTLAYILS